MREAGKVRAGIERLGRRRRNEEIPPGLRARATRVITEQRARGATWRSIAESVGLSVNTVKRWVAKKAARGGRRRERERMLVPVRVRTQTNGAERPAGLVVVTASGMRVEGLGVSEAAALLRELGA